MPQQANTQGVIPVPAVSGVEIVKVDTIVASMNHRQRSAIVQKYELLKTVEQESLQKEFPSMSHLEQYIAGKIHNEANAKIVSDKMPSWRGTIHTFAPDLDSKNETIRTVAEQRLVSLRDEMQASHSSTDVVKWYKIKTDKTSKDEHIVRVCKFFNVEPSSIA